MKCAGQPPFERFAQFRHGRRIAKSLRAPISASCAIHPPAPAASTRIRFARSKNPGDLRGRSACPQIRNRRACAAGTKRAAHR